jgi:hypothetical protein
MPKMPYKNTSRCIRRETNSLIRLSNFNMSESRMQGNLHVRFGVDLLISNEIGKLGHYYLWEQYFPSSVDYITGLKKSLEYNTLKF